MKNYEMSSGEGSGESTPGITHTRQMPEAPDGERRAWLEERLPALSPEFPDDRALWIELKVRRLIAPAPLGVPLTAPELRHAKDDFSAWSGKSVNTVNHDWRRALRRFTYNSKGFLDLPERASS